MGHTNDFGGGGRFLVGKRRRCRVRQEAGGSGFPEGVLELERPYDGSTRGSAGAGAGGCSSGWEWFLLPRRSRG